MPTTIIAAVVGAAVSGGIAVLAGAAFGAAFLQAFAVNLVFGLASKALAPKPQAPSLVYDSATRTQSVRQPITPWRVVFGTDRVGGAITFMAPMVGQNYVLAVITLTCHRVKAIRELYYNDELVPVLDNLNVTGRYAGYTNVKKSLGTEAGQPFADLVINSGGKWTDAAWQKGHAKLRLWLYRDRSVYTNGIPNVTTVLDGYDQVWDPRTGTYVFSSNPALCTATYLITPRFNKSAVDYATGIDETALIAAANICDERISQVYQPAFTVDAGTDTLTFTATESQLKTGDACKYVSTGGAAGGLASGSVYYLIITGAATAKLATSRANALAGMAIDLTSAGSGTQTLERMPIFTADASTDRLTFEAPELRTQRGDGVRLESTGTLPAGLAASTTYYWIPVSETEGQLATTYANAFAGTAINITDAGTGVHRVKPYDEVRYATNGTFSLDQHPQDIIDQLVEPMAGRATKIGGKWRIIAGAYTAPAITFTDTEMDGPRQVQVMPGRQENANGMKGVFVGPENFYQPTDFVPVTNATYLTVDNSERVWKDVQYTLVRRHSLSRRLAKIALERIRQGLVFTLQGKISTYRAQPGDIVGVTISRYGWSNKAFEIINSKLVLRGSGDDLRFGVDHLVRETASGIFTWSATENSAADISPNTTLPDPFELARQPPPTPSGLEIFGQGNDTTFIGRDCKFAWRRSSVTGSFEFGSEPQDQGAGAGQLDWFFAGYVVRVYKSDGTLLREERGINDPEYTYTHEKNYEDTAGAPVRAFTIKVWQKTTLGRESLIPAQLSVSNDAPTTSAPAVTASVKGLVFTFAKPSETDFNGFKLWGSTSNGFTADDSTLLYSGFDTEKVIGNLTTGVSFYYKYCACDTFGDGTVSSQQTANPGVVALSVDLQNNAATTLSSAFDVSSTLQKPGMGTDRLVCNWISTSVDLTLAATVTVQGQGTFKPTAAANNKILFTLFDIRPTARYTTGSIVSITGSGGNGFLNGSGTGWLSAGFSVGDKIILADGYPLCTVFNVISDTQIQIQGMPNPPLNSYSGSYVGLKSGGVSATPNACSADLTADKAAPVALFGTAATPTSGGATEQVFIMTAEPDSGASAWSATIGLTQSGVLLQAFKSTR